MFHFRMLQELLFATLLHDSRRNVVDFHIVMRTLEDLFQNVGISPAFSEISVLLVRRRQCFSNFRIFCRIYSKHSGENVATLSNKMTLLEIFPLARRCRSTRRTRCSPRRTRTWASAASCSAASRRRGRPSERPST